LISEGCIDNNQLVLIKLIPYIFSQYGLRKQQINFLLEENGWGGINNHYEFFTLSNAGLGTPRVPWNMAIIKKTEKKQLIAINGNNSEQELEKDGIKNRIIRGLRNFKNWYDVQPKLIQNTVLLFIPLYFTIMFLL